MTDPLTRLRHFLREPQRRNVYKVAATYLAVAFVGFQAANLLIPDTNLPGWTDRLLLAVLIVGFPVAVVVAWAFEMMPEGVRRTPKAEPAEEDSPKDGQRLSTGYNVLLGRGLGGRRPGAAAPGQGGPGPGSATERFGGRDQ